MSNYLSKIIYLTENQYNTLITNNSITINGVSQAYDSNALYITDSNLLTSSPSASGTATAFITDISQAANGKITATKANLPLTLTAAATGFTIAGGTTSKTLTVAGTATINAPTQGGVVYGGASGAYSSTSAGTSGQLLQSAGTGTPTWITATDSNTASTVVKRDASGNFSAGTITASLSGNASTATTAIYIFNRTTLVKGTNPSTNKGFYQAYLLESGTGVSDTNRIGGSMQSTIDTSGKTILHLQAYRFTASVATSNALTIEIAKNGTCSYSVSDKAAFRTAIDALAIDGTAQSLQATTSISGGSSGTHAQALQTYFNSYKASTPRNKLLAFYDSTGGNGSITFGYFLEGYDSNPYGGFFSAHYNTPYYIGIQNGTFTQSQLWKAGDSVTGAVWNDYAEYRKATTTEPGRCVEENDNGTLTLTKCRLMPGASIISDTWGFSQGKSEEAKTPVAVSGRVLAYPCRDRSKYHAGQAVCSGPNGTVDIMTRREIQEYPDAIIGIVSEIPDYEEWGGGDRDPVKVNGRIWIKVR